MLKPALAGLGLIIAGTPAALPLPPPPSVDIAIRESDLADPAAIEALRARIAEAARDVCREHVTGDLLRSHTLPDCIRDTRERALSQLDSLLEQQAAIPARPGGTRREP